MISDPQIMAPVVDNSGRSTLTWANWWVQVQSALNGFLGAFTVGKNNAVTITNPSGFAFNPGWQDWGAVLTPSGSMTLSAITFDMHEYLLIGQVCFLMIKAEFTPGGTVSNSLTINLPTGVTSHGVEMPVEVNLYGTTGGSWCKALGFLNGSTMTIYADGTTNGNFTTGVQCFLEIAAWFRSA